jgi:hypothetical protein
MYCKDFLLNSQRLNQGMLKNDQIFYKHRLIGIGYR